MYCDRNYTVSLYDGPLPTYNPDFYYYEVEILYMMLAFGDPKPKKHSARTIHEIVKTQMNYLLLKADEYADIQGKGIVSHEHILFQMRKNKIKIKRLLEYLNIMDSSSQFKSATCEDTKDIKGVTKSRSKRVEECLSFFREIEDLGELSSIYSDETIIDEGVKKRRRRSKIVADGMGTGEYFEYFKMVTNASFSPMHKGKVEFKNWLLDPGYAIIDKDITPFALTIIEFLARETVGELVDMAFLIREKKRQYSETRNMHFNKEKFLRRVAKLKTYITHKPQDLSADLRNLVMKSIEKLHESKEVLSCKIKSEDEETIQSAEVYSCHIGDHNYNVNSGQCDEKGSIKEANQCDEKGRIKEANQSDEKGSIEEADQCDQKRSKEDYEQCDEKGSNEEANRFDEKRSKEDDEKGDETSSNEDDEQCDEDDDENINDDDDDEEDINTDDDEDINTDDDEDVSDDDDEDIDDDMNSDGDEKINDNYKQHVEISGGEDVNVLTLRTNNVVEKHEKPMSSSHDEDDNVQLTILRATSDGSDKKGILSLDSKTNTKSHQDTVVCEEGINDKSNCGKKRKQTSEKEEPERKSKKRTPAGSICDYSDSKPGGTTKPGTNVTELLHNTSQLNSDDSSIKTTMINRVQDQEFSKAAHPFKEEEPPPSEQANAAENDNHEFVILKEPKSEPIFSPTLCKTPEFKHPLNEDASTSGASYDFLEDVKVPIKEVSSALSLNSASSAPDNEDELLKYMIQNQMLEIPNEIADTYLTEDFKSVVIDGSITPLEVVDAYYRFRRSHRPVLDFGDWRHHDPPIVGLILASEYVNYPLL